MKKIFCVMLLPIFLITACSTPSRNVYNFKEAGQSVIVEFGTVIDTNPIDITGPNTGVGAGVGGLAGAGAGSTMGSGNGTVAAVVGGAVIGAAAGAMAEQAMANRKGIAYTIVTEHGKTITVAQYYKPEEVPISVNERVMVQTSGSYQRVLPAEHLPETIKRPKGIEVVD